MENPNSWSEAARIINEAHTDWYNNDDYQWCSIGRFIESRLQAAGLLMPAAFVNAYQSDKWMQRLEHE